MNYIPGFSNYLETSLPRYARGGRARFDEPMMYDGGPTLGDDFNFSGSEMVVPAVQPMVQEPVAETQYVSPLEQVAQTPQELSYEQREARRIAANTPPRGTSITGPYAGKKPLAFGDDNTFDVREGQAVRVVDAKGNVIFSGSGVEDAKRAVAVAQSLSDDLGKNANYKIQAGQFIAPTGETRYYDVARAAPSQSGLGFLADNVLPFAASFIPVIGPVAGAALGSAVSSGLQGRSLEDALKRAAIAGATAGAVKVSGLDTTIGGALSNTAGQTAGQAAGQVAGQAAGGAGGDIVVSGLSKALQSAGGALGSAALSQAANAGLSDVTGYKTPTEQVAQQPTAETSQAPIDDYAGVDPIDVLARRASSGSGVPFGAAFPIPVNAMLAGTLNATQPAQQNKTAEDIEAERNPMVVTGSGLESLTPDELLLALGGVGGLAAATTGGGVGSTAATQAEDDIIKVTGRLPTTTPPVVAGIGAAIPAITQGALSPAQTSSTPPKDGLTAKDIADYLRLASLGISTVGGLLGGDKGGGARGTIPAGMGALSSLFSKQLPPSTLPGGAGGGALPASTLAAQGFNSPQNYYRYGYGPEQSFFSYATQGAPNISRAYTGYEGTAAEDAFAPQPARVAMPQPALPQITLPQPITTPIPEEPRGPSMYAPDVDRMRFALGGSAVEGEGDGRDDKIPALLSDGEYVIDAETVALLGNGSNKAGAKLLDSFRVKVRKQKGKKLARGEFSDNAKRPEQYMAGGQA